MSVNIIQEIYIDALMIYYDVVDCIYMCFSIPRKRDRECESDREPTMYDDDGEVWEHV
jgi:hypothetical protein